MLTCMPINPSLWKQRQQRSEVQGLGWWDGSELRALAALPENPNLVPSYDPHTLCSLKQEKWFKIICSYLVWANLDYNTIKTKQKRKLKKQRLRKLSVLEKSDNKIKSVFAYCAGCMCTSISINIHTQFLPRKIKSPCVMAVPGYQLDYIYN